MRPQQLGAPASQATPRTNPNSLKQCFTRRSAKSNVPPINPENNRSGAKGRDWAGDGNRFAAREGAADANLGRHTRVFYWIYDLPVWTVAFLFAAIFISFGTLGAVFIRPLLRLFVSKKPGFNDIVGYVLSFVSVIYGVLLGMMAIVTYQNLSEADEVTTHEASTVAILYRDAGGYPEPLRTSMRAQLRDYVRYVLDEEWNKQKWGILLGSGGAKLTQVQTAIASFEPANKAQEIAHLATFQQFNRLIEYRRMRLHRGEASIPAIMWYTVVMGAVLSMFLVWLFDTTLMSQLVLSGLASFGMSTMICLSALMDNPFRGELSVSPAAFETVFKSLMSE